MVNLLRQAWRSLRCWLSGHVEPDPDVWHLGGIFTTAEGTWCAFERPCNRCGLTLSTKWGMDPAIAEVARKASSDTNTTTEGEK